MTQESFNDALSHGVLVKHCVQEPKEILYVPMGWMMIESVPAENSLIFGMRRSCFLKMQGGDAYKVLMNMQSSGGQSTERMQTLYKKLTPSSE